MTTTLLEAGRKVLNHLNARIDNADRSAVPVFDGIAELHCAVHAAEAAGAKPIYLCMMQGEDEAEPRLRAWTAHQIRAQQLQNDGLPMVAYYAQPDIHRSASAAPEEGMKEDYDSAAIRQTGERILKMSNAALPSDSGKAAPKWHRDLIDREPDHGQYAKGGNANAAPSSLEEWIKAEFTGHGVAIRKQTDAPIPGEPLMSMAEAKELTRRAVAAFASAAPLLSDDDYVAVLERIAEIIRDETRTTDSGVVHNSTDVARMILERTVRTDGWSLEGFLADMPDREAAKVIEAAIARIGAMKIAAPGGLMSSKAAAEEMDTALRAMALAKVLPGWKLVPIEPTEDMLAAACERAQSTEVLLDDTRFACDRAGYKAAIAAAPEPLT